MHRQKRLVVLLSFFMTFVLVLQIRTARNDGNSATKLLSELAKNSKILCWILANPVNELRWKHLKILYGKNCDKFIIMTSLNRMKHIEGLELHGLNVSEGRNSLVERCYKGFQYVYEKYYQDYDFFMRTDEDTYFVMENLRYLLNQYDPELALWIGEKFHHESLDSYLYKVNFH
jgi:glycoprotein-N-acetylgalactosamine 3-beta-galactosyltransferase